MHVTTKEATRKTSYDALIKLFPHVVEGVGGSTLTMRTLTSPSAAAIPAISKIVTGKLTPAALPEVSQEELDAMEDVIAEQYLREAIDIANEKDRNGG